MKKRLKLLIKEMVRAIIIENNNGKFLIKNKKTGSVYFVKKVNKDKHDIISIPNTKKNIADKNSKDKNPAAIAPLSKEIRKKLIQEFKNDMKKKNLKLGYRKIFGRTFPVGIDNAENKIVYDWDGNQYQYEEFFDIEKQRRIKERKLNRILDIDLYLDSIPQESKDTINKLKETKTISYEFLTDDKQIKNKLTRSYPVVDYKEQKLIVDGKFKGYYLEDMINRAGRQISGTAYILDDNGLPRPIEYKDGKVTKFRTQNEPYLTKNKNKYRLVYPKNDKIAIKKLKELSKVYKTIRFRKTSNTVDIDITDFNTINEALGGLAISQTASEDVLNNIKRKKKLNEIEMNKTYENISVKKIRGLKQNSKYDFMAHQKKAISVVTERGGNTVVGLDTGTGKTATAFGIMQTWLNDGTLKKDKKNGRILVVTPTSLKGNFPAQAQQWMEDTSKIDVVSYGEFRKNSKKYEKHGAIFFDEAQQLRNTKSNVAKAALTLNHPRKIPLTASVLEKSPMDLFNLVAVATNKGGDPVVLKKESQYFIKTFCNKVGGKVIGLKEDPTTKRKFKEWVKQNTLFIDKTEVEEMPLPETTPAEEKTESLKMNKRIREAYKAFSQPIHDTLQRMVEKYKNKELKTTEINQEISKVMGQIQKLKSFTNNPEDYVKGVKTNPKIHRAEAIIEERLQKNDNAKTVTFTDNPELAEKSVKQLSKKFPHKKHLVALAGKIDIYQNGKIIKSYNQSSKLIDPETNEKISKDEWQVYLINKYQKSKDISTMNMTSAYTTGHNIQSADFIIHYDRNSWNNEHMKQRDARVWRTGQTKNVGVKILDLVNDEGTSIDNIQKFSMKIEQDLFDEMIKKAKDVKLGEDYNITNFKDLVKNKENLLYMLDPNLKNLFNIKNEEENSEDKK